MTINAEAIIPRVGIITLFTVLKSFSLNIFKKIGIYIAYNATIGNSEESNANHPTWYVFVSASKVPSNLIKPFAFSTLYVPIKAVSKFSMKK